jgi:rubredoxin
MVLAVAFDDVKARRQHRTPPDISGGVTQTLYFGSSTEPDQPHASLNEPDAGLLASTHFHRVDQFQVVVGGKGKIGRHELSPYCVHFTRAYTPYGPLLSDPADALKFIVMRARHDAGSQRLPKERAQLERVTDRRPWQVSRQVSFASGATGNDVTLDAVPEIMDDQGLAAYALSMKPLTWTTTPDPARGDGQYLVVLKGSVILNQTQTKGALALIFVSPADGPLNFQAGPEGVEALILNFPRRKEYKTAEQKAALDAAGYKTWICMPCAYIYDEAVGIPEEGIAPGTRWADVPEDWTCPDCGVDKNDFEMAGPST